MCADEVHSAAADRCVGPLLKGLNDFEGTPLTQPLLHKGTYSAPWEGGNLSRGACDLLRWKVGCGAPKFPSKKEAAAKCPSVPVDKHNVASAAAQDVQATWMGHASFLVQANGINILTDPVWSSRASPVQFAGPKRYVEPPIALEKLPCHVHVVTVSHNHYDHLDTATVRTLQRLFKPQWVVPFGMKRDWFAAEFAKDREALDSVHEVGWWECATVSVSKDTPANPPVALHVTGVPVQHWAMRKPVGDRNTQLWCGFVYETVAVGGRVQRMFHSGDTGYCRMFKDVGRVFGKFDLAMIPIGAYHPRWFLNVQHCDPAEAVQIHEDLNRPTLSLGMHWGTFILTDEPIDEPPVLLRDALLARGLPTSEFRALAHGETVQVGKASTAPLS